MRRKREAEGGDFCYNYIAKVGGILPPSPLVRAPQAAKRERTPQAAAAPQAAKRERTPTPHETECCPRAPSRRPRGAASHRSATERRLSTVAQFPGTASQSRRNPVLFRCCGVVSHPRDIGGSVSVNFHGGGVTLRPNNLGYVIYDQNRIGD